MDPAARYSIAESHSTRFGLPRPEDECLSAWQHVRVNEHVAIGVARYVPVAAECLGVAIPSAGVVRVPAPAMRALIDDPDIMLDWMFGGIVTCSPISANSKSS